MRRFRILSALLAALITATAFTGCIRIQKIDPANNPATTGPATATDNGENETTGGGITLPGTDDGNTDGEPIPVNFTLDLLCEENSIPTLLQWNDTVTIHRTYDGGETTECYWLHDGDRVAMSESISEEYNSVAGSYRGFDFYVYPQDWTTATKWVTREAEVYDSWIDTSINRYFPAALSEDIEITAEDENNYTVRLVENLEMEDGRTTPCVNTAVINKATLFVQSFAWEYFDGDTRYYGGFDVEYNGERIYADVMDDWEGTRTVTIDIQTEESTRTEEFSFPERWQLRCLPDEGIYLHSDNAFEEEGTILIGANSGAVTVIARDEANLSASGTEGGATTVEGLPFTIEELTELNRITNLTKKYGTVNLTTRTEDYTQVTSFYRRGDEFVRVDELKGELDGETLSYVSGQIGDYRFDSDFEGHVTLYAEIPEPEDSEDYLFYDTNADGEHYVSDLYLTEALQFTAFGTIGDVKEYPNAYTFRFQYDYEGGEEDYVEYEVDNVSLYINALVYGLDGSAVRVTRGDEVGYASVIDEAFAETRDIFVHYEDGVEVHYEVPASWAFTIGYFDDLGFWADEGLKTPMDPVIPGDGENYEFWITRAVG